MENEEILEKKFDQVARKTLSEIKKVSLND